MNQLLRLSTHGLHALNARLIAEKLSSHSTRAIGVLLGDRSPFYYVSEYPKSGGTWLAAMISDYLQLPFPQHSVLPLTFSCVVQNHWRFHPRLTRSFYLYRDGRDVVVSLYYDRLRLARHSNSPAREYVARTYEKLLGPKYDPEDIARHLPRFIEFEFNNPGRGASLNWRDHIEDWVRPERKGTMAYLSYERLKQDCVGTLSEAIESLTQTPIDTVRLQRTVEKMSMQRQTGREPGQSDITQHVRKGVVGDWRNHFTREAAGVFDEMAGDTLVHLGYENDRKWVDRYDYPTE